MENHKQEALLPRLRREDAWISHSQLVVQPKNTQPQRPSSLQKKPKEVNGVSSICDLYLSRSDLPTQPCLRRCRVPPPCPPGMSPQLPDSGGQAAGKGAGGSGTVGLTPWPKSNTKPRWTCSHYERKRQSLQVRLQGKKVVMFSFSLFPLFSFFQKFLVVIKLKSLSFCSCHCKCSFFRFTRFHSSKKITN